MKVAEFDLDNVCTFLTAIGLGDKAEPFRENCVDGSLLCTLTTEDLTSDLGLTGLQAKKLLRSIDAENNSTNTVSGSIDTTRDKVAALEAENAALQRAVIAARADVRVAQGSQNVVVTAPPPPQSAVPAPAPAPPPPRQQKKKGPSVLGGAAVGAAGGAAQGAIVGAILPGMSARDGAKAGAAVGGLRGGLRRVGRR